MIRLHVRLFNRMRQYADDGRDRFELSVPDRITYSHLLEILKIPEKDVFVAFRNGRNIALFPGNDILTDGDVIALSGPVPFSRGYGAPVV